MTCLPRRLGLVCLCLLLVCCPALALAQAAQPDNPSVKHILVLGQDYYNPSSTIYARTDTVLLVSIDNLNKQIVLTSILRDSMVTTPKGAQNKINSIYRNHGFEGVKATIENHLGITLEGTVIMDFETTKKLITALGGVDLTIDVNEYLMIRSILRGEDPDMPKGPGYVHMSGRIALAYMRDRSSGSGDFSRTERQRKVLTQLFDKCKSLGLSQLLEVYEVLREGINTDIGFIKMMSIMQTAKGLLSAELVTHAIPSGRTYSYGQLRGSSVLDVDWKRNAQLFQALFRPQDVNGPATTGSPALTLPTLQGPAIP